MKIEFGSYIKYLSIGKLSKLMFITIDDYGKQFQNKINFPSGGAHEMIVIHGREDDFENIGDFLIHMSSIRYAKFTHFELPNDFEIQVRNLKPLSKIELDIHLKAYSKGFFEILFPIAINLNLWSLSFNIEDFIEGYKVEAQGTGQYIICHTSKYYLYFTYISIN